MNIQKITPFLWFDKECEEAINYYVDVFNAAPYKKQESKIVSIARYEKGLEAPGAEELEGKILTGVFELEGQKFMALDGGPYFKFNEAVSFQIECQDQKEVDYFWEKLSAVKESEQCGWVKDKFGLSWQIVPKRFYELMEDENHKKVMAVGNALLKMHKIVIEDLEKAANEA